MRVPLPQADIVSLRGKVHKGFLSYCGKRFQHGCAKMDVPGAKTPLFIRGRYRSAEALRHPKARGTMDRVIKEEPLRSIEVDGYKWPRYGSNCISPMWVLPSD
jgi:hypothetical protein